MGLRDDFTAFTFQNVSQVPHLAGVFQLADKTRDVIYIAKAQDLKNDLLEIFDSSLPCFLDAKFYGLEINPEIDAGYRKLFRKHKADHRGRKPRCNSDDPTLMDSSSYS